MFNGKCSMLIEKIDKKLVHPIELREVIATEKDAKFIEQIQIEIQKDTLDDGNGKKVFAIDNIDFIMSIINSKRGVIVLYFNDKEFVSLFELSVPDNPYELEEKYHISKYLPDVDINNIGVAETLLVMPKYRGNHLQVKMFKRMEQIAKECNITSLIGTVHPKNIYSSNSFDIAGYDTISIIDCHGGTRFLKYKDIQLNKTL